MCTNVASECSYGSLICPFCLPKTVFILCVLYSDLQFRLIIDTCRKYLIHPSLSIVIFYELFILLWFTFEQIYDFKIENLNQLT